MSETPITHAIKLRKTAGISGDGDLILMIQEKTFEYLQAPNRPDIKISAYLDRDWSLVETRYEEVFLDDDQVFKVMQITPGSRVRKVMLPGPMVEGEQIVIQVVKAKE